MTAQRNFIELTKWLQTKPGTIASCHNEAVAQMSYRFRPHVIDGSHSALKNLDFKHYEKDFCGISVNYLQYGPEVKIDAGDFESGSISSNSRNAIILSPGYPIKSTWKHNTQQVMLKIDKMLVQKSIEKRFGKTEPHRSFIFDPYVASESLSITRISELLRILASEETLSGESKNYNPRPLLEAIIDTLVGDVALYTAPISSRLLSGCRPGHLSRFLSLLDDPEMLLRPISELASRAGATDRTLRNSAQRFLNASSHELIMLPSQVPE